MSEQLGGVFPVLPTPFQADGSIDIAGFERITTFVLDSGADGVVFPGLASEYDHLSLEERLSLIAIVGRLAQGRAYFIVGASATSDAETLTLMKAGHEAGATGAMVMTPFRLAGDIMAISAFYERIHRQSGLPVMLQNAPKPMGLALSPAEVLVIAAAAPGVRWVKEENMPCGQRISVLLAAALPSLEGVFGGAGGRYITDELARGAAGTMPASELPEINVALYAAHRAGDRAKVRDLYQAMLPVLLMQAVFRWDLTKEILRRRGLMRSAHVRAPGPRFDAGDHRELSEMLALLEPLTGPILDPRENAEA